MTDDRLVGEPLLVPKEVTDEMCDRCGRRVAPGEFIHRTGVSIKDMKWNCAECVTRLEAS